MATTIQAQIKQIKSSIKSKDFASVYLLKGDEPFYIDLICKEFEDNVISEDNRDFNQTILYGRDTTAEMLVSACRQYPLMTDKRLVLLKEAQLMDKSQWPKILLYLNNSQPSTILVICNKAKEFDIKCKNAIVKNAGVVVESNKIPDYNVAKWIVSYVQSKQFTIDETAANMLNDYLGNDLQKIANEIDKMILNITTRKNITYDDISEFIGISKNYSIFELQKALSVKNVLKSNQIINYFAENQKEMPIQMFMPILFSYFTKLLIASEVYTRNAENIARALNFRSPFAAKDYVTALNYYSNEQLLNIIALFNEYDLKSKGIGTAPNTTADTIMKELVFKILHV